VKKTPVKEVVKVAVQRNHPWDVIRFVLHLPNFVRLFARLLRDPRVAAGPKLLFLATAAYIFSPVDFLPDLMPMLGQVDDLGLLLLGCRALLSFSPRPVVEEHVATIDASGGWRPVG